MHVVWEFTHMICLKEEKKKQKITSLGGETPYRPLLATVCSAGGALSELTHNTRSFSTLRSRLRLRGNESSALAVDLNVAPFKAAFPDAFFFLYGGAAMHLRFSSAFFISLVQTFSLSARFKGRFPNLAPQYGYSIPYNESEHGGQINPAPPPRPPLWCAEDTISPLCVQWH